MTTMETKEYENKLLNKLLLDNDVSENLVNTYAKLHMYKIREMMDIFDHKEISDQRLAFALFNILDKDHGDEIAEFYRCEYKLNANLDYTFEDILLLLATCKKNSAFFSFALSVCERIKAELKITYLRIDRYKDPQLEHAAAASKNENFREFFKESISPYNGIGGTFRFMGDKEKNIYLEFVFDKPQETIPFEVELFFVTTRDHKEQPLIIAKNPVRDEDRKNVAIRSDLKEGIDYSGGIEAGYEIRLKPPSNS